LKISFFVQLLLIVILAAVVTPSLVSSKANKALFAPYLEELNRYYGGPTLSALAVALDYKSKTQRAAYLERQKANLTHRITLQDTAVVSQNLSATQRRAMLNEELVYKVQSNDLLLLLPDHSQVLVLVDIRNSHLEMQSEGAREGLGLMTMLQRQLNLIDPAFWPQLIVEKSKLFNFPVTLEKATVLTLSPEQQKRLDDGYVVAIISDEFATYGSGVNYLLQRAANSQQLIIVGPIGSAISDWIEDYQLTHSLLLSALITSLLCLWLFPSWRSSRSLVQFIKVYKTQSASTPMKQHRLSHFNLLHKTFNQMSDNINNLFSYNKLAIYYLSQHLNKPLQHMQQQLEALSVQPDLVLTDAQLIEFETNIDAIRSISSELLLFSKVQRMNELTETVNVDLALWIENHFPASVQRQKQLSMALNSSGQKSRIQPTLLFNCLEKLIATLDSNKMAIELEVAPLKASATFFSGPSTQRARAYLPQHGPSYVQLRIHIDTHDQRSAADVHELSARMQQLVAFTAGHLEHFKLNIDAIYSHSIAISQHSENEQANAQVAQLPLAFCGKVLKLHRAQLTLKTDERSLALLIHFPLQGAQNE